MFSNRQSENERNISMEIQESHPSQFDSYFAILSDFSFNNICDYTFTVNEFDNTACADISQGLLQ